jgi:hypothetical protein
MTLTKGDSASCPWGPFGFLLENAIPLAGEAGAPDRQQERNVSAVERFFEGSVPGIRDAALPAFSRFANIFPEP